MTARRPDGAFRRGRLIVHQRLRLRGKEAVTATTAFLVVRRCGQGPLGSVAAMTAPFLPIAAFFLTAKALKIPSGVPVP